VSLPEDFCFIHIELHSESKGEACSASTGVAVKTLMTSPDLQRVLIRNIANVVREEWTTTTPRARQPYGDSKAMQCRMERSLSHQLCEWSKTDFQETVCTPQTMLNARD
jgi:hypothetical protein